METKIIVSLWDQHDNVLLDSRENTTEEMAAVLDSPYSPLLSVGDEIPFDGKNRKIIAMHLGHSHHLANAHIHETLHLQFVVKIQL